MFGPLNLRRRRLAASPTLLRPPLHHLSTASTHRVPTTPVAVLWDLTTCRPLSKLPLFDAAVRLHLAASSFGRVRLSAAFLHPSHCLPTPEPSIPATNLYRFCGRRFRARDALLRHFDTIHTREHAKRLERIDSSPGDRRVRLASSLSLKLSKYTKAARELTAAADPGSPAEDLRRARVLPELSRTPSASLRERAQELLDGGSLGCLMLVSVNEELAPLLRLAREKGVRSVVVGAESGLARWADVGFRWAEVVAGEARKAQAAPSMSSKWRDRDVLKGLEWRYEEDEEEEEVVFEEDGDEDGFGESEGNSKGDPWWNLESDAVLDEWCSIQLEDGLRRVNAKLNVAAVKLKKTREERDQFDEASNQIVLHLKAKEDELSRSVASCKVEASTVRAWINFLEDTWKLQSLYEEIKEKQANDELDRCGVCFVNLIKHHVSACVEELSTSIDHIKTFVDNLKIFSDRSVSSEDGDNGQSKQSNPRKYLEEQYLETEKKVVAAFSLADNIRALTFPSPERKNWRDNPEVKNLFASIDKLRVKFETVPRPVLQIEIKEREERSLRSRSLSFKCSGTPTHSRNVSPIAPQLRTRLPSESDSELAKFDQDYKECSADDISGWEFDDLEDELRPGLTYPE